MGDPKVSVIMPAYNAAKYISEAIESILNQTFGDFEFIIIDDCSTDNTWDIIQKYKEKDDRIIPIRNDENLKICKTLNKGIEIAKGVYIARMDADDISLVDRFEKQVDFLDNHADIGILGGSMEIIDKNGKVRNKRTYHLTDSEIRKYIFRYSPFCHPAAMMRQDVLNLSGLYNPNLVYAEDYDLYFRIGLYSQFANLDKVVIRYRMLDNNSTSKKLQEMENKTLYIRLKACTEYGYNMAIIDKLYLIIQYLSGFLITGKIRIFIFNLFRH